MKLFNTIEFYVGLEFDKDNKPISRTPEDGLTTLLQFFQGVTFTSGFGAWESITSPIRGDIVKEKQVTYTVILEEGAVSDPVYTARLAAEELKRAYNQSAVLVTIRSTLAAFV